MKCPKCGNCGLVYVKHLTERVWPEEDGRIRDDRLEVECHDAYIECPDCGHFFGYNLSDRDGEEYVTLHTC